MGWGGRWEGGSGWGTHVNPWLIHVNVWQKPLQYCKVVSLQLIKIIGKKIKKKDVGLQNHGGSSIFNFLRKFHTVCNSGYNSLHSYYKGSLFSMSLPHLLFDNSHPNKYEVIAHCGFNLSFPDV